MFSLDLNYHQLSQTFNNFELASLTVLKGLSGPLYSNQSYAYFLSARYRASRPWSVSWVMLFILVNTSLCSFRFLLKLSVLCRIKNFSLIKYALSDQQLAMQVVASPCQSVLSPCHFRVLVLELQHYMPDCLYFLLCHSTMCYKCTPYEPLAHKIDILYQQKWPI